MIRIISLIAGLVVVQDTFASSFLFGVTQEFCHKKFDGKIAFKGDPFNITDVIDKNLPARRIIDEFVTSDVAYLWYEHGGRGYHQHLVRFNVLKPEEVLESYTFFKTEHTNISSLIKHKDTLTPNKQGEL